MESKTETLTLSLIHSAQQGQQSSRSSLVERIRPKVYAYCYRMTLDTHVAEDLCQETMVSLLKNFERLSFATPSHLWAWVYKTALNQIRDHCNHQKIVQSSIAEMQEEVRYTCSTEIHGPDQAIREELLHSVTEAIKALKLQYRHVLTLRCFQQLSYAQIGQIMGQSELSARMLFFRAKQSLTRQLTRDGFKPGHLLPGLSLFAAATLAPSEVATATVVSHITLHTGLLVKLLSLLTTGKAALVGLVIVSVVTLSVFWKPAAPPAILHPVSQEDIDRINPSYPTTLVNAYDPDQSGWQGASIREDQSNLAHRPVGITLEQWISHPTGPEAIWIHLPREHWLEIDFGAAIIDGQGDDVFVTERCTHGEAGEIYLVDSEGKLRLLGLLQIPRKREHGAVTYGFDLAQLWRPISSQVLRIRCTSNGIKEYRSAQPGMELLHVRARTY